MPDFRFKGEAPMSAIIDAVASKRLKEQQMANMEQERRSSKLNNMLQTASFAAGLIEKSISNAKDRQRTEDVKVLSELLSQGERPTQIPSLMPEGFIGPAPSTTVPLRETPQFRNQLKSSLFKVAPEIATQELAQSLFSPGGKQGTPPRSLEGVYVDQFNQGLIDEPTMVKKIQENNPEVTVVEDPSTKLRYIYDRRTGQSKQLFSPQVPSLGGKSEGKQFTPVEKEAIAKARTEFSASPDVKELSLALTATERARSLIKANPKAAGGLIKTQLAKMVENNRLSDQDIQRISGSPAAVDRANRAITEIAKGKLSEVDQKDFLLILDIMEQASADELDDILNNTVQGLTFDVSGADPKALRAAIGRGDVQKLERIKKKKSQGLDIGTQTKKATLRWNDKTEKLEPVK